MGWFTKDRDEGGDENKRQEDEDLRVMGWLWKKYKERKQRKAEDQERRRKDIEKSVGRALGEKNDA